MYFLELVLPLATPTTYHYQLAPHQFNSDIDTLVGRRAVVPFGGKRFYTGIIVSVSLTPPEGISSSKLKYVLSLVDDSPLVPSAQIDLWHWMADYYCASLGSVLRLAVPHGLLPESRTIIHLNPDFIATTSLSALEVQVLDILAQAGDDGLTLERLQSMIEQRVSRAYYRLLALGAISTDEVIRSHYKPKLKACLRLSEAYRTDDALEQVFRDMKRATKRMEVLTSFLSALLSLGGDYAALIPRGQLTSGDASIAIHLRKLVELGVLELVQVADSRLNTSDEENLNIACDKSNEYSAYTLTQSVTLLRSRDIESKESSIIAQVKDVITAGGQVLLLSPSASGVPRAAYYLSALKQASKGKMYHYHPDVSEAKRIELYKHLSSTEEACLILGNRSAIFLPCRRLQLIIIDDEQEYMYKHQYTAPLFHARDVALYLAAKECIPVLLSSCSPSAETLFNVLRGKYGSIDLDKGTLVNSPIPSIEIIDLKKEKLEARGKAISVISTSLRIHVERVLAKGQRVLLLQNRRGYAPYMLCSVCSAAVKCPRCAISMSYYASRRLLSCSQCGYSEPLPQACPSCYATESKRKDKLIPALRLVGYGTERVEEEVNELFPDARVMRLDGETLQTAGRRQESLERIEAGDVDIIVGTQVIKTQPIWDNIGLIAVVQLDDILGYPDFRAGERAYQLLYQMALYRANGASEQDFRIVLQTSEPKHPFIEALKRFDYDAYIKEVLGERQRYHWPPFTRVSYVVVKGYDEHDTEKMAHVYAQVLQGKLGKEWVSGAQALSAIKIEGRYVRHIVCRRPYNVSFREERRVFKEVLEWLRATYPNYSRVHISFDIDPL